MDLNVKIAMFFFITIFTTSIITDMVKSFDFSKKFDTVFGEPTLNSSVSFNHTHSTIGFIQNYSSTGAFALSAGFSTMVLLAPVIN